ncbi:MAG: branched-chain amino acid ABC transporter permease [Actinomycetota bacterium]
MIATQPYLEVTVAGLAAGAVFALLALGLVLIYRTTGVLNFGHWAVGLMGITVYALLTGAGVPVLVAVLASIATSVVAGVCAYRFVFRWVPRASQIIVILIAFGIAQLFSSLAQLALGFKNLTTIPGWLPRFDLHLGGATLQGRDVITALTAIALALGFLAWFRKSRTGRALRAVAQNREAAMLAGIDDVRYSSIAWGIGAALAAIAILLILPNKAAAPGNSYQGLINTVDLTPLGTLLIPAFGAALVGGLVNMPAALVGGFVFGLAQNLLVLAPKPWSTLPDTIAAALIVILLLVRMERLYTTQQEREALEA